MTIRDMADRLGVPTCTGGCGLSATRHRTGCIFLGVVHFAERRFSRRAAKNYLMLVARRDREMNDGYLNHEVYDWWYVWHDSVTAAVMARLLGFRLPAAIFARERALCRLLADRRGVKLSRYRRVAAWVRG